MKLVPSDPDVETLVKRIERKDLDLQPDFQRGDVWTTQKQQKLIDSILRGWHVPPIHVVESQEHNVLEVLDGQQRLRSIYNFATNVFPVNGSIEPSDRRIIELDGYTYANLPRPVKRAFNNFTIRQFTITDFLSQEPAELFYRLNQPLVLTAAETRNAFIGETRSQIRSLAKLMEQRGYSRESIGFSNARMAYDDVLSRLCMALERGSIATLITAGDLAQRYRSGEPFARSLIDALRQSIEIFGRVVETSSRMRINKAGLFSWLWFTHELLDWTGEAGAKLLPELVWDFEMRRGIPTAERQFKDRQSDSEQQPMDSILRLYDDRVTSRVANVASVAARNLALWAFTLAQVDHPLSGERRDFIAKRTMHFARALFGAPSPDVQETVVDEYIHMLRDARLSA